MALTSLHGSRARERDAREPASTHACLGCPAEARGVLCDAVAPRAPRACLFASHVLEARQRVAEAWSGEGGLAIVRRGYLIRERTDAAGGAAAVDVAGPGCSFPIGGGALASGEPSTVLHAVTRVLVCTCDGPALEAVFEQGGATARELHALLRETNQRIERLAAARARTTCAGQVAALLCALTDTLRPGRREPRIPPEFAQRDLARLLSLRHESVCRTLRDFETRGLIRRDGGGLVIADRRALERV